MPEPSYAWKSPYAGLMVRIRRDVIFRLSLEAMEAKKSIPRRGLEVGGILLGRSATAEGQTCLYVDDFVAVPSEHRSGPSYLLSETDLQRFKQCLARNANAIGVYRSHTRGKSLCLQVDDVDLFEHCLQGAGKLFLLVSPFLAQGAFFLPENGTLALAHSFPFRVSELKFESDEPDPVSSRPEASPDTAPNAPYHGSNGSGRWKLKYTPWRMRLALAVFAVLAAAILAVREERAPVPVPQAVERQLALDILSEGPRLLLRWNPQAPAVRDANYAKLHITDGMHNSSIDLEESDLASGAIVYWPESQDVLFRMEVFSPSGASFESIRFMGAKPAGKSPEQAPSVLASALKPKVEMDKTQAKPANPKPPTEERPAPRPSSTHLAKNVAERVVIEGAAQPQSGHFATTELSGPTVGIPEPAATASPAISQKAETPKIPQDTADRAGVLITGAAAAPPGPFISVTTEPVLESGMRRAFGRIPLLGRLKKSPQAYEPPKPISQSRPQLSDLNRAAIHEATPVDVKVYVTPSGAVEYAEVVSHLPQRDLAAAAVYAARRWTFVPARLGGEQVPGEIILHFVFLPPLGARQ